MTVHFIGAGPGAFDLITVRGRDILAQCPVCLYAGSTVDQRLLDYCPANVRAINTAALDLDALKEEYQRAWLQGVDVARLHSGDLSIYSALTEQLEVLEELGIPYTITPGVPAFAAASAVLQRELTVPEVAQSVVLTRLSGRASKMPEAERLEQFAASGATLAIHLAIHRLAEIVERVQPFYGEECPVALVYRASWPEQRTLESTLGQVVASFQAEPMERSVLILIGPALGQHANRKSALYRQGYCRRFR